MVCGYREFMTWLKILVHTFVPLSVGYSFSKEEPKEYKSLIKTVVYFPLRFFVGITSETEHIKTHSLFGLFMRRSYMGKIFGRFPSLETGVIKMYNIFASLSTHLGYNLNTKNPYPTIRPVSVSEKNAIRSYRNKYKGRRCFILGNGPSLNKIDLGKLKNEITFGANGIFFMTKKNGFKTNFYVVTDVSAVKNYSEDILKYQSTKFISAEHKHFFYQNTDIMFFPISRRFDRYGRLSFSWDCSKCVYSGHTVTYVCVQFAFYMGFSHIYLIGMDFDYEMPQYYDKTKKTYIWKSTGEKDPNHFDSDYWSGPNIEIGVNDLGKMGLNYKFAKKIADKRGKSIYNATVGGKLEIFERVDYNSLF